MTTTIDYEPHALSGTLLHDTPEHPPVFGQWVCDCGPCQIAVRASIQLGTMYVVKGSTGREVLTARRLTDLMAEGQLDMLAARAGIGYVREVFVAETR